MTLAELVNDVDDPNKSLINGDFHDFFGNDSAFADATDSSRISLPSRVRGGPSIVSPCYFLLLLARVILISES